MPRPVPQPPRYCLSFTAAGLRPELAAVIAAIHLEEQGDWARTKAVVLERNALQARSASSGKRLESELRQRLQGLTNPQLQLLARGTTEERSAMAWLAVLKRIQIAADLTREVVLGKLSSLDPVLRRSDMAAFYEDCERDHPELSALAPSSQQKVRSALLQMLRDAGLLAGKAGKGGTLGTVQRPFLSPGVQEVVAGDDPALLAGFLLQAPAKPAKNLKAASPPHTTSRPLQDQHGSTACGFRTDGPFSRFDHHEPDQRRGIHHSAFSLSGCVVEVFGDTGVVETQGCGLSLIRTSRPLQLLDLRGSGAMRAGSVAALSAIADRDLSQAWSRHFYSTHAVDGLLYSNAHKGEAAIALVDRAEGAISCSRDLALDAPLLRSRLLQICRDHALVMA